MQLLLKTLCGSPVPSRSIRGARCRGWGAAPWRPQIAVCGGRSPTPSALPPFLRPPGEPGREGRIPGAAPLALCLCCLLGYSTLGGGAENFLIFACPLPLSPVSSKSLRKVVFGGRGSAGISPGRSGCWSSGVKEGPLWSPSAARRPRACRPASE